MFAKRPTLIFSAAVLVGLAIASLALIPAKPEDIAPPNAESGEAQESESAAPSTDSSTPPRKSPSKERAPSVDTNAVGLSVPVSFYDRPMPSWSVPSGGAVEEYEYFKYLAENGDGIAAHKLANMVHPCTTDYFRTREELDYAVQQMRETFSFVYPDTGHVVRADNAQAADIFERMAIRSHQICTRSSGDNRQSYRHWLEVAADAAHTVAMLDYANTLDDPEAALELMREAWLIGDPNGLLALSHELQALYETGVDPGAKVPAAAAMYAFVYLQQQRFSPSEESVVGRIALHYQRQLEELERLLLPHERRAAMEQAGEMIASNENCCYRP